MIDYSFLIDFMLLRHNSHTITFQLMKYGIKHDTHHSYEYIGQTLYKNGQTNANVKNSG